MVAISMIAHAGETSLPMALGTAYTVLAAGVLAFAVLAYLVYRDYRRAVGGGQL